MYKRHKEKEREGNAQSSIQDMWISPLKDLLRPFELLNQKLASGGVSKLWFSVVKRGAGKKKGGLDQITIKIILNQ